MQTRILIATLLIAPALTRSTPATSATDGSASELARLSPHDTLVYVEAQGLDELFERGLGHPGVASLLQSELGRRALADMQATPEQALAWGELMLGFPILPTLASLTDRGVALSIAVRGDTPRFAAVLRTSDPELLEDTLLELLHTVARKKGGASELRGPGRALLGAEVWPLDKAHLALAGDTLVLAGDTEILEEVLALNTDAELPSLADRDSFASAREAGGESGGELLWGYWDFDATERVGGEGALRKLRALPHQPPVQFLLGPGVAAAGSAAQLTLTLSLKDHGLHARAVAQGVEPDGAARAVAPQLAAETETPFRLPPAPKPHPGDVATALLHRNAAELVRRRTELFETRHLPKFSEALGNLALFFGGAEIEDEILPHLSPWVRLVSREVDFEPRLAPAIPLPAAALLIDVDEAERMGFELEAGFQTMVGLINVDRAQKGKPPLRMRLESIGGAQMTRAHLPPPRGDDPSGLDLGYNLEPACAFVGRTFVIGTHASLVADLLRELPAQRSTESRTEVPRAEQLELTAATVRELLHANREALVMNAVLNEGKSHEEAENDLDFLLGIAHWLHRLSIEISYGAPGEIDARLELTWNREV